MFKTKEHALGEETTLDLSNWYQKINLNISGDYPLNHSIGLYSCGISDNMNSSSFYHDIMNSPPPQGYENFPILLKKIVTRDLYHTF
jgi:hypothetical protein